jgi:DNA-binding transcriptional regulator YhcF (GntR family)
MNGTTSSDSQIRYDVVMTTRDPDDPRPPYLQVASSLRAAILTGALQPGDKLPTQADLAAQYGIARMTLQQSLRILRDEGLIVSRQGSGVFVRERRQPPADLGTHLDIAFAGQDVVLDFAGYTADPLKSALREPLEKIRQGRLTPKTVHLRMLLADLSRPIALPARTAAAGADEPNVRAHFERLSDAHTLEVTGTIEQLRDLSLVKQATVQIRVHGSAPLVAMYLVNDKELFLGLSRVVERRVKIDSKTVKVHEPTIDNTELVNHSANADPNSAGSRQVEQAAEWFDNIWSSLGRPHQPPDRRPADAGQLRPRPAKSAR